MSVGGVMSCFSTPFSGHLATIDDVIDVLANCGGQSVRADNNNCRPTAVGLRLSDDAMHQRSSGPLLVGL